MSLTRKEKIEAMLRDDPNDQFLRYSLAMELRKDPDVELCIPWFRGLMVDSQPYVAAFFMLGQHLVAQDRIEEARTVLRDGIEEARRQSNFHAAGEMSELLISLGGAGE